MARSILAGAAILVLSACGDATGPPETQPAPAYLDLLEGDVQETWVGNPLPLPLSVRVRDEAGAPLAGVPVAWDASGSTGTLSPGMATTDEAGEARTTWTLGLEEGESIARATVLGLSAVTFTARGRVPEGRVFDDRLDDLVGEQIHVLYVVPGGGTDRALDAEGVLTRSVASFHSWFRAHARLSIRFDTYDGELDVTFVRLDQSDQQISQSGAGVVSAIEAELLASGRIEAGKNNLVYYDGESTYACGGAAWPPRNPGHVAAMYLRGAPNGVACPSDFVGSAGDFPRYWEFAALHDLVHTFGIVSRSAPHHTDTHPGHVPEPNDLMYTGPSNWVLDFTTTVDVGGDDYLGAAVPEGVRRLDMSPFVIPDDTPPPTLIPPGRAALEALAKQAAGLPVHPPFPGGRESGR